MESEYDPPLSDLVPELGRIAGNNILEEVHLTAIIMKDPSYQGPAKDDWSQFDSLLTRPGSFPRLRLVTVQILWCTFLDSVDEMDEGMFDSVTEKTFTKLVDSPNVEFRFSATYS